MYSNGYSGSSLVHYVLGAIPHVSPGAHMDFVQGRDWTKVEVWVRELLAKHDNDVDKTSLGMYNALTSGTVPS